MKNIIYYCFVSLFIFLSCTNSAQTGIKTPERKKMPDDSLLTLVQHQTFKYFWDGAEPVSGMACERINTNNIYPEKDKNIITTGGSGFGFMAVLVGIERGFITREEGLARFEKNIDFLKKADRFHGAWPHWLNGETGKVKPFGQKDDGADLVETSYLLQGLLAVRQYFKDGNPREKSLAAEIDKLWKEVDFKWFTQGKDVIYWHWSPNYNWEMNFPVEGYNECLIMYVLAASSPTHPVDAAAYHKGWARNGAINGNSTKDGYTLTLKHNGAPEYGGPLFWAHYSYLGLDPRNLTDEYANYWKENKNQTLINRQWCIENPKHYKGYGADCWGLTASYSVNFYAGHAPGMQNDLGVITPTAAISSFPYTPEYSMEALKHFYYDLGDKIWGEYGFYDAFSEQSDWYPKQYLAIDQGPEVVMIENYRSGLLWNLFMSSPEVKQGLKKLDFKSPSIDK
jgi:hypothetical protein